ncbi:MAG TPA: Panacea domain-containing protein [Candidatus Hypogeohydataceae bacterium YC41]
MNKNVQIIKFIVERLPGRLGRVHLIKLIYLADYYSRRLYGKPVSTFDYIWWNHGPFDKKFYEDVENLKPDYIWEEEICFLSDRGCISYRYHDGPARIKYSFTDSERYTLEYVIRTFGKADLGALLEEVVYKTEPMDQLLRKGKKAFGSKLNMKIIDNVDRALYGGLNPEDIIEGEKALQEGKVRSLEEMFSALQS